MEAENNMASRKKTFLFITDTDYEKGNLTGAHKRFLELVKDISESYNVMLVSRAIPELKGYDNVKRYDLPKKNPRFVPAHINKIIKICRILHKEKKNIVYDYAVSFGPVDTFCYGINGYKNITTLFREDFVGYKKIENVSGLKLWYFKMLERYAVKHSQKIIVQCEDDKKALIRRCGKYDNNLKSKIYIQVNNVNASWIRKHKVPVKKHNDIIKIMFIGNFSDARKGQQILLPAVKKLLDDGYCLELFVLGDGRQLEKYKNEYSGYKNIKFLGRVKDVNGLLSESDFEMVPSLMDSCPNTVLEGLNAGVAVYGTNVGGIREILQNDNYLFQPTVDSIYKFIKKKIDGKQYIKDARDQRSVKENLTFNWSGRILGIITRQEVVGDEC